MTDSSSTASFRPELQEFLYAPVGEDSGDMPLSVISALARLGIDPWAEAAALAGLPEEVATRRLATLIARLRGTTSAQRDPGQIAAQLIARLPERTRRRVVWRRGMPSGRPITTTRAFRFGVILGTILGVQWLLTRCQPPTRPDSPAQTSRTLNPQSRQ